LGGFGWEQNVGSSGYQAAPRQVGQYIGCHWPWWFH
jgi:hypothetical protein